MCMLPIWSLGQQRKDAAAIFRTLTIPDNQLLYKISVTAENMIYQVRVNDIPLMTTRINGRLVFFANPAIVKSGRQQISINYKPANTNTTNTIQATVDESGGESAPVTLWKYDGIEKEPATGEFNANIPLALHNWEHSASISKDDKTPIGKAELWYKQMAAYLKAGKGDAFMNNLLKAEMLTYQASYFTAEKALAQHNEWKNYINKGGIKLAGMENAHIEIVGNGKLLHLVDPSGDGGLVILYDKRRIVFDIFLHFPTGATEPETILYNMKDEHI